MDSVSSNTFTVFYLNFIMLYEYVETLHFFILLGQGVSIVKKIYINKNTSNFNKELLF